MEIVTPAVDPAVSVEEFKRSVHVRQADVDDDAEFAALLSAAEDVISAATGHILAPQQLAFTIDRPAQDFCRWFVPVRPVTGIIRVQVAERGSDLVDPGSAGVSLLHETDNPQVFFSDAWAGWDLDFDMMRITLGAGAVEHRRPRLVQAIKLLTKEWFEAQISLEGSEPPRMTVGVTRLVKQSKFCRICEFGI